jgi:hypothetical protein
MIIFIRPVSNSHIRKTYLISDLHLHRMTFLSAVTEKCPCCSLFTYTIRNIYPLFALLFKVSLQAMVEYYTRTLELVTGMEWDNRHTYMLLLQLAVRYGSR